MIGFSMILLVLVSKRTVVSVTILCAPADAKVEGPFTIDSNWEIAKSVRGYD